MIRTQTYRDGGLLRLNEVVSTSLLDDSVRLFV